MLIGPPGALVASVVAVIIDRPRGFAIAALVLSGLTCLMVGGLVLFSVIMSASL